jgi:hypothetical protein
VVVRNCRHVAHGCDCGFDRGGRRGGNDNRLTIVPLRRRGLRKLDWTTADNVSGAWGRASFLSPWWDRTTDLHMTTAENSAATFKVMPFTGKSGWYVLLTWQSGRREEIIGFSSKLDAETWIAEDSSVWLCARKIALSAVRRSN